MSPRHVVPHTLAPLSFSPVHVIIIQPQPYWCLVAFITAAKNTAVFGLHIVPHQPPSTGLIGPTLIGKQFDKINQKNHNVLYYVVGIC